MIGNTRKVSDKILFEAKTVILFALKSETCTVWFSFYLISCSFPKCISNKPGSWCLLSISSRKCNCKRKWLKTISENKKIFKGACLRYDAVENILIGTPFAGGMDCWNAADWIVIISPVFIFVGIVLFVGLGLGGAFDWCRFETLSVKFSCIINALCIVFLAKIYKSLRANKKIFQKISGVMAEIISAKII